MYLETIKVLEFRRASLCFWAKTSVGPAISLPLLPCAKPTTGLLLVSACSSPSPLAQQLAQWPLPLGAHRHATDCRRVPGRHANPVPHPAGRTDPVAQAPPPRAGLVFHLESGVENRRKISPIGDRTQSKANQSLTTSNDLEIGSLARTRSISEKTPMKEGPDNPQI
jgi:hypothetical protein